MGPLLLPSCHSRRSRGTNFTILPICALLSGKSNCNIHIQLCASKRPLLRHTSKHYGTLKQHCCWSSAESLQWKCTWPQKRDSRLILVWEPSPAANWDLGVNFSFLSLFTSVHLYGFAHLHPRLQWGYTGPEKTSSQFHVFWSFLTKTKAKTKVISIAYFCWVNFI